MSRRFLSPLLSSPNSSDRSQLQLKPCWSCATWKETQLSSNLLQLAGFGSYEMKCSALDPGLANQAADCVPVVLPSVNAERSDRAERDKKPRSGLTPAQRRSRQLLSCSGARDERASGGCALTAALRPRCLVQRCHPAAVP